MKSKNRGNIIFVILVILLAFLFTPLFIPDASRFNHNPVCSVSVKSRVYFHDEMDQSINDNLFPGNSGPDISLNNNSFHSHNIFTGSLPENAQWISSTPVHVSPFSISQIRIDFNTFSTDRSVGQKVISYPASSLQFRNTNSSLFPSSLFSGKEKQRNSSGNYQKDTVQSHYGFYSFTLDLATVSCLSSDHYSGIPNDIVDPGGPPDGDPIPIPDGFYFLIFLGVIYACRKLNIFCTINRKKLQS